MDKIYAKSSAIESAATFPLKRVRCKDETQELHELLKANHDLLPGDQIDPDIPRHWLLIKHEMPVTDPSTGADRWSIDFFFADQFGIPTLVECKRCDDTRSRREVTAQMLEYAANGHHYWTASEMRSFAESTAGSAEALKTALAALRPGDDQTVEQYFTIVEQNLREAKMRLIFFLEKSPNELRSLVDFMNRQMKDTEVLLVEARQYEHNGSRIIVPWLFGFTEEARVAKRDSRAETIRASGERGEEAFWRGVDTIGVNEETRKEMHSLVAQLSSGSLAQNGEVVYAVNCIFLLPALLPTRGLFSLKRNGSLEFYFGYWDEAKYSDVKAKQIAVRDELIAMTEKIFGVGFTDRQKHGFPITRPDNWQPHADDFFDAVEAIAKKYAD